MCPFWHDAESLLPKEVELQRAEDMAQQRAVEMPGTAENRMPFALESKGTTWKIYTTADWFHRLPLGSRLCLTPQTVARRLHHVSPRTFWQENGATIVAEMNWWKQDQKKKSININICTFTQRPCQVPAWSRYNKAYQSARFIYLHKAA